MQIHFRRSRFFRWRMIPVAVILLLGGFGVKAQLIVSPSELAINYTFGGVSHNLIRIINPTDSTFYFNWELYMADSLRMYIRRDLHDMNIGWAEHVHSNCSYNKPNRLFAQDTGGISLNYWFYEIPSHIIDSTIRLELKVLTHPDCDSTLFTVPVTIGVDLTKTQGVVDSGFGIYPNPFSGHLMIERPLTETGEYLIYDSVGKVIMHGTIDGSILSTEHLAEGIYICVLTGDMGSETKLLTKSK